MSILIEKLEECLVKFKDRKLEDKLKSTKQSMIHGIGMTDDLLLKEKELKGAQNRAVQIKK
jgi:hypothetical protein